MNRKEEVLRRRLKLVEVDHETFQDGRCAVRVHMEWRDRAVHATREGTETLQGILRAAALATLEAADAAAEDGLTLELVGVKAIRAFDAEVIIAAVRGHTETDRYRLLGSCAAATDTDPARASVLAVLDAVNRVLERYVPVD